MTRKIPATVRKPSASQVHNVPPLRLEKWLQPQAESASQRTRPRPRHLRSAPAPVSIDQQTPNTKPHTSIIISNATTLFRFGFFNSPMRLAHPFRDVCLHHFHRTLIWPVSRLSIMFSISGHSLQVLRSQNLQTSNRSASLVFLYGPRSLNVAPYESLSLYSRYCIPHFKSLFDPTA